MIYLQSLDRNQIISHSVNKHEIHVHPALSDIAKFMSLSIYIYICKVLHVADNFISKLHCLR